MTLAFIPPPCPDSFLRRLDPRARLAGLLLAVFFVSLLRWSPTILAALLGSALLARIAHLPLAWWGQRVGGAAIFLALLTLPLPFLSEGPGPSVSLGPVTVSWHGTLVALLIWAKALSVLTLMLVLIATGPLPETLKAAHALHIPGLGIQLALLTYRYLFVFAEELGRIRTALRLRAFRARANRHTYRTVGNIAGTLLVRGSERAERVHQAMRCRGFQGQFHSLADYHLKPVDVACCVGLAGLTGMLLVLDVMMR